MKELLERFKQPRGAWLIVAWLLGLGGAACSIAVVALESEGWWVYLVYTLAALFLAYAIYALVKFVPRASGAIAALGKKYPALGKWLGTYEHRTLLFSACSFIVNVGYVVLNLVIAVLTASLWYGALAAYYFALGALRYDVLGGTRVAKKRIKDERSLTAEKLRIYRNCGIALLILEGLFMLAMVQFLLSSGGRLEEIAMQNLHTYTMITMIASAAYTFYKVAFAIYNVVKVHKMDDPELWALRNINLTAALVSLIALQTTMTLFLEQTLSSAMRILNGIAGTAVGLFVAGLAVVMIVRANGKLRQIRIDVPSGQNDSEKRNG